MYIIETIEFDACKIRRLKQAQQPKDRVTGSKEIVLIIVDQSEGCVRWKRIFIFSMAWRQAFI